MVSLLLHLARFDGVLARPVWKRDGVREDADWHGCPDRESRWWCIVAQGYFARIETLAALVVTGRSSPVRFRRVALRWLSAGQS
ncbi:MAG: hypothetical protein CMJ70_22275 [Planctomycetaceae bacterium]|nr:hypothetical protein [Planctomycetaceae bacterium]